MSLISLEKFENIGIIKLEDSKRKNVASRELLNGIANLLDECLKIPDIPGVIITGTENVFCAGADLKEAENLDNFFEYVKIGRKVIDKIFNYKKPVIAALNGLAFGGGLEIALACDLIYATQDAQVALPEVSLGMFPGWGGTQLLSRRTGPGIAKEMIFTGKKISAEEAWETGLVDRLFENENSMQFNATETIKQMSLNCPQAIYKAKEMINLFYSKTAQQGMQTELEEFGKWLNKEHAIEGINSFFEKRKPNWK